MASALYIRAVASGAKAQNVDWLASGVPPGVKAGKVLKFILQIAVSVTDAILEVTFDDGVTFSKLNEGVALTQGNLFTFDVYVKFGDLFNIRASNAGGTTVDVFLATGDLDA